jgi:hypothetical protein
VPLLGAGDGRLPDSHSWGSVEFLFEEAEQDGYGFRAVEAWPSGHRHRGPASDTGGGGYVSTVTIHLDPEDATD